MPVFSGRRNRLPHLAQGLFEIGNVWGMFAEPAAWVEELPGMGI
jgi:hypothetical protein